MDSEIIAQNNGSFLVRSMVSETADFIRLKTNIELHIAIVCGSGMGELATLLNSNTVTIISYKDIPHFPESSVHGHAGKLLIGQLNGVGFFIMQGRFHPYEGYPYWLCAYSVRIMAHLGCKLVIVTNAAGGLREDFKIGDLMLIKDHLNMPGFAGQNPLRGINDAYFGKRFVPMSDAYDKELISQVHIIAAKLGITIKEGVYAMVGGPNYETVAESRALKMLGGDAVGMSTIHEVIVARQCGMKVLGFSLITNMCVMNYETTDSADHLMVLDEALKASLQIKRILEVLISEYRDKLLL